MNKTIEERKNSIKEDPSTENVLNELKDMFLEAENESIRKIAEDSGAPIEECRRRYKEAKEKLYESYKKNKNSGNQ